MSQQQEYRQPAQMTTRNAPRSLVREVAAKTSPILLVFLVAWLTPLYVALPRRSARAFAVVAVFAFFLQAVFWANGLITYWVQKSSAQHGTTDVRSASTISSFATLVRFGVWVLLALLALDNLGIQIKALIAGLGITGLAVALAGQTVLSDLFAALAIAFDKPFLVGDLISVGAAPEGFQGRVEHVGLKSTRVRSDSGELVIIANGELLKARIRNYSR
jgi:small-conductance mechanosensitive channel